MGTLPTEVGSPTESNLQPVSTHLHEVSTYTFRLRKEEFSPIKVSHTSWAMCAMISTMERS